MPDWKSPSDIAVEIWGQAHDDGHSRGARAVRDAANDLFPRAEANKYRHWRFDDAEAAKVRAAAKAAGLPGPWSGPPRTSDAG